MQTAASYLLFISSQVLFFCRCWVRGDDKKKSEGSISLWGMHYIHYLRRLGVCATALVCMQ